MRFDTMSTTSKMQKQPATSACNVLERKLVYECFSRFLSCTNGTKPRNTSHTSQSHVTPSYIKKLVVKEKYKVSTVNFF